MVQDSSVPNRRKLLPAAGMGAVLWLALALPGGAQNRSTAPASGPRRSDLSRAEYYVGQLEAAAKRSRGKRFDPRRYGQQAMTRVKSLYEKWPDHPKVKELYDRVKGCVKRSRGDVFEITPEMLRYRKTEQQLAGKLATVTKDAWAAYEKRLRASRRFLPSPFPAPDPALGDSESTMLHRRVILDDFRYPQNEFTNTGAQFCWVGSSTQGMYYVELSNPLWVGAYEALKRYRSEVNGKLPETWTVTGTIIGSDVLVRTSGSKKDQHLAHFGWIVRPDAIYVKGVVFAKANRGDDRGGSWAGEDQLAALKAPFLTYTSVPNDATPEQLLTIFATAIKEKNYDLYLECLDPEIKKGPKALGRMRYYWDINQRRFAEWYVHVHPGKTDPIIALKGERLEGSLEAFFLDEKEKKEIEKRADDLVEQIAVIITKFDERGKQVAFPQRVYLRRYQGGRWYVHSGFPL